MRLLLSLLLLVLALPASAEVINGTVTWDGEKRVSTKIRVEKNGHLVIKPGSNIIFAAGATLEVAGRLSARDAIFTGTDWTGIVLKGAGVDTLITSSTISGARIGIQVIGGAPRLEELVFEGNAVGAELRQQSEATVAGSTFRENSKVGLFVKDGAAAAILNNHFEKNGKYGVYIFRATPRRFSGNVFSLHATALMVAYSGSNPLIADNCFDQNKVAIRVEKAAKPTITGSDISRNGVGISLYRRADPVIENNLLRKNDIGIEVAFSSYPTIVDNDFLDNGKAIYLEYQSSRWELSKGAQARQVESNRSAFGSLEKSSTGLPAPAKLDGTVDARGNWWGADGLAHLVKVGRDGNPDFIDDGRDRPTFLEEGEEYRLDKVVFHPWRQTPVFGGGQP